MSLEERIASLTGKVEEMIEVTKKLQVTMLEVMNVRSFAPPTVTDEPEDVEVVDDDDTHEIKTSDGKPLDWFVCLHCGDKAQTPGLAPLQCDCGIPSYEKYSSKRSATIASNKIKKNEAATHRETEQTKAPETKADGPTLDDLRQLATKAVITLGKPTVKTLITKYADNLSAVPEDKRAGLKADIEEALNEAKDL